MDGRVKPGHDKKLGLKDSNKLYPRSIRHAKQPRLA